MRERLLLESYVAGFIATGTPQNVPCEFPDLSLDTAPNQALRATARLALDRCGLLRLPEARSELARRARRVLARFAGVRDTPLHKRTFPTLRRGWPPRRYLPILNRAEAFASGLYADRDIGQHAHQAFMWDMDRLYQEALRGIIAGWGTGRLRSGRPTATICDPHGNRLGQATRVDPDYVLDTPRGTLLLDAKQKDTTATSINDPEVSLPGVDRLKVSRGDVYPFVE